MTQNLMNQNNEVTHSSRRSLLKLLALGGGVVVAGKLFGSLTDLFSDKEISRTEFQNFKLVETKKTLTVSDKTGEALLVIEKDGM